MEIEEALAYFRDMGLNAHLVNLEKMVLFGAVELVEHEDVFEIIEEPTFSIYYENNEWMGVTQDLTKRSEPYVSKKSTSLKEVVHFLGNILEQLK